MARALSPNPNLEQEKKRAKGLLRAQRGRDPTVCERLRQLARFTGKSDEEILDAKVSLAEAQHALAKERGFLNWAELKRHIVGLRDPTEIGLTVHTGWPFNASEAGRRQREAASALGLPLRQRVDAGLVGLDLVLIPPGEFMMGDPETGPSRVGAKATLHRVRISRPFYIGITPITQAQWQALMGTNPSQFRGPDRPVEGVSWRSCQKLEERLYRSTGMSFRLPTEAEWEYCCRAGSASAFYFGDDAEGIGDFAWCKENSGGETHDVALKRPNAFGLHDMMGNVSEWCEDSFDLDGPGPEAVTDPQGPAVNPDDVASGVDRVTRGGGWSDPATDLQAPRRSGRSRSYNSGALGLRIVLEIPGHTRARKRGAREKEPAKHPPLVSVNGCTLREESGYLRLTSTADDGTGGRTTLAYTPPLRVRLRARTDSTNIRINYGIGTLIFNWEVDPKRLILCDLLKPGDHNEHHVPGRGFLEPDRWHDIVWEIDPDETRVVANGELLLSHKDDYSSLRAPVMVGPAWGSTVDIASMTIESQESIIQVLNKAVIRNVGGMVWLKALKPCRQAYTLVGCLLSCMEYLDQEETPEWVFGGTGQAFAMNVATNLDPRGIWDWPNTDFDRLARNIGCEVESISVGSDGLDPQENRQRAFEGLRRAIDGGRAVLGFGLRDPEWCLCFGYDDKGNCLYWDGDGNARRLHHTNLGAGECRHAELKLIGLGEVFDHQTVVREALEFGLAVGSGGFRGEAAEGGIAAYDAWIEALGSAEVEAVSAEGCALHAANWRDCRQMAVGFLKEARGSLTDSRLHPLFDAAIKHYAQVSKRMRAIARSFPFEPKNPEAMLKRVREKRRRQRAVTGLKAARAAERKGLEALAQISTKLKQRG